MGFTFTNQFSILRLKQLKLCAKEIFLQPCGNNCLFGFKFHDTPQLDAFSTLKSDLDS